MNKGLLSIGSLAAAVVLFLALNILAGVTMRSARIDLTENHLYTLSAGSKNIARKLDEPINLTLYFSEKQANDLPAFKSYGQRVTEVLREYALASAGKIKVQVVNPDPFSEAEDRASQSGLAAVPVGRPGGGREQFYFGLVGVNSTGKQQTIAFFDPQKEEFLEYDITRLIYLLSDPPRKTVGLMASLPIEGSMGNPMLGERGQTPAWQIVTQMKELFDVKTLAPDAAQIPDDVRVLMLVHPKNLGDKTQYAIDQFVLRGGRLLVFVDPWCDVDLPPGVNPMQAMGIPRNSNLTKLFDAWGVEMLEGKFAADRHAAIAVTVGTQARPESVDFVAWLKLDHDNLDRSDSITGTLQQMDMYIPGILQKKAGATTDLLPLIQTGPESMPMDVQTVQFMPDPKRLLADFKSGDKRLILAARVTGKVKTAFPEGKPPDKPTPDQKPPTPPASPAPHIAESAEPINVIVVADADMLHDHFWIQEQRLGQLSLGFRKVADNGDFVIGALDNLSGSSDLMNIRARGRFSRPFERVQQIQKSAEQRFLAKQQELQTRLQQTESKLTELQRKRPDAGAADVILTPEQQAEIEKFQKERVATRKELRDVQHQMNQDIERLGAQLKFINIGLMPLLVGVAAVGLSAYRVSRRRTARAPAQPAA